LSPFYWPQNMWPWMAILRYQYILLFDKLKLHIYLFTYMDSTRNLCILVNSSMVIVGQLITAKKLWRVDHMFFGCHVTSWVWAFCWHVVYSFKLLFILESITFLEIKRNVSNNYIDILCCEALRCYNNHYDDNLEVGGLSCCPYRSQRYYTV